MIPLFTECTVAEFYDLESTRLRSTGGRIIKMDRKQGIIAVLEGSVGCIASIEKLSYGEALTLFNKLLKA